MSLWTTIAQPALAPQGKEEKLYLLIDAAQIDRFGVKLAANRLVLAHEPLFGHPIAPDKADATPHLLAVAGPEAAQAVQHAWADSMFSHGALAWLVSPLLRGDLAQRLRSRLDARLPERFDCVNRFFDGRVTPHLHACLSPAQREAFFCVGTQWWVVDHTHRWLSLPCAFSEHDAFEPPLELDERQQAHLIDACYPYAVIDHFMQTDEELLDSLPPNERYGFVRGALQTAAQYGIDGGATAILFCTLALTRGPAFYTRAPWQASLDQVKRGEITLQQAVKAHHD